MESKIEDLSSIPGYEEFCSLLQEGDYSLYHAIRGLGSLYSDHTFSQLIMDGLREKAKLGDEAALLSLASLEFKILNDQSTYSINYEITNEKKSPRHAVIIHLSDLLGNFIPISKEKGYSETLNRLTSISRDLRKAAYDGNQQAMCLWLLCGSYFEQPYAPDTWKDIHTFTDILLQNGHAEFMRKFVTSYDKAQKEECLYLPLGVPSLNYSRESHRKMVENSQLLLYQRQDDYIMNQHLDKLKLPGQHKIQSSSVPNTGEKVFVEHLIKYLPPRLIVLPRVYILLHDLSSTEQEKKQLVNTLDKLSHEGNLMAKYALSDLLMYSGRKDKTEEEIIILLEEAWSLSRNDTDELFTKAINDYDPTVNRSAYFGERILPKLFHFYADEKGRHYSRENQIRILHEIKYHHDINSGIYTSPAWTFYYLGIMYEKGLGVPRNTGKAIEFYKLSLEKTLESQYPESQKRLDDLLKHEENKTPMPDI